MTRLPGGAITDLAYLSLITACFKVASDVTEEQGVIVLSKDYHTSKKIKRNVDRIVERADKTLRGLTPAELKRVKKRQKAVFDHFLATAPDPVEIDTYALMLMYERFAERDKPLHPMLQWTREVNYDYIHDLINKAGVPDSVIGTMYDHATKLGNLL